MPDEGKLPPGPRRDLVLAVHDLYELAGKPPVRSISERIHERGDLPGTLSHEGVSAVLRGAGGVPRWLNLESLVRVLVERRRVGIGDTDVEAIVIQIHELWRIADGGPETPRQHRIGLLVNTNSMQAAGIDEKSPNTTAEWQGNQEVSDSPLAPLLRWNVRQRTLDIFDRQVAVEVIKEVGGVDDQP
jgi:hypothetical protein